MRLFLYGTLMDPEIFSVVAGQQVPDDWCEPATLMNYRRARVRGETYPALVPTAGDSVAGLIVSGPSDPAIDRIRFFEGSEYTLGQIAVRLTAQGPEVPASVFLAAQAGAIVGGDWSFSAWQASSARARDLRLSRAWMEFYGRYSFDDPKLDTVWTELCEADARKHGPMGAFN